jgi:hypothetical protein
MTLHLVNKFTEFVNDNQEPTWGAVFLDQTYDSAVRDQGDWRCNATLLYIVGALTNDGLRAGVCMIYYVTVSHLLRTTCQYTTNS